MPATMRAMKMTIPAMSHSSMRMSFCNVFFISVIVPSFSSQFDRVFFNVVKASLT